MLINEAGWVAFGFIIFCIIAWRYGAKPFVDVLEARANEVKEKLSEAENLRNEAKEVLDNFKVLQKEAENEAEKITAVENSKKFNSRQEEQIKQKIKAAEKQALLDVKNLVVDLSVEATKEYLIKEIDEKHSNKLVLDSSKTLNKSI